MSRLGRVGNAVLWLGAVAGAGCLLLMVLGPLLGLRPLLFRSGSMSPAIETGDVAIGRTVQAADLATGDIVSVIAESGQRVTHRVVGVEAKGDAAVLRLKGDANPSVDQEAYLVSEADRVWFVIPWAGHPIVWLSTPVGLVGLGLATAGVLFLAVRGRRRDDPPGPTRPRSPGGRRRATRSAVAGGAAAALMVAGPAAAAAWTDDVSVNNTVLSAWVVTKPVFTSSPCVVTGNVVTGYTATITWNAASDPKGVPLVYTATIRETSNSRPVTGTGATRSTTVTSGLLSSLLGTTVHVDIVASISGTAAWKSATSTQDLDVPLLGLLFSCGSRS